MSVDRIEEWLRKMGYDGKIPSSLSKICNPSTSFIWEQLMTNIKPRQEARVIKHNLIIDRLTKTPIDKQGDYSYPIKEIEIYAQKKKLEQKMHALESQIREKEAMIDNQLKKNKKMYVQIDTIKARIKENQEKRFLLQRKSKMLEKEIVNAQETLTLARNLTPVEVEASSSEDDITKTLQKCAEKLLKISEDVYSQKRTKSTSKLLIKHTKTPTAVSRKLFKTVNQSLNDLISTNPSRFADKENWDFSNISHSHALKFPIEAAIDERSVKNKARESLGLLSDEFDSFLNSNVDNFLQSSSLDSFTTKNDPENTVVKKLYKNQVVTDALKQLLHKNNRFMIVTQWKVIFDNLINEITCLVTDSIQPRCSKGISQEDWTKLYFTHIKSELQREKHETVLKQLKTITKKQKEEHTIKMVDKSSGVRMLDLQIEQAYLTAATHFLRREIDSLKKREAPVDLAEITSRIENIMAEIGQKQEYSQELIAHANRVLEDIRNNQEEFHVSLQRLNPYFSDLSWASVLEQDVNSEEVETFKSFPLEFNRSFHTNQGRVYCRNVSKMTIPSYIHLGPNDLDTVATIMDLPFSYAESVIFKALNSRLALNTLLRALESRPDFSNISYEKYSREELIKQEDYVEPVINKLNSIINSVGVKDVLSAPKEFKEVGDLWLEMPFRYYISKERIVDGHDYEYYENILKNLQKRSI